MRRWLIAACVLLPIPSSFGAERASPRVDEVRLLPLGSPPADVIDVVDLRSASADTKLAAVTLQGHANAQAKSCVYLLLSENTHDARWLDWLRQGGYIRRTNKLSPDAFFRMHAGICETVVVYDPELPATINVGTMIASLERGIVVAPGDLHKHRADRKVVDLRGRWKTNVDAYEWAFADLRPHMTNRLLACYHPTSIPHHIRDYLICHRVFVFWITSRGKEDGSKSSFAAERRFAEKLFKATPVNTPVIGFWYSAADPGISEYEGVGLAGRYGKLTVACDWTTNLSLLSGIRVNVAKRVAAYRSRLTEPQVELDRRKVYLCFDVVESGDAPVYWQAAQYDVWRDPKRGQIPINWSLGPAAVELIPPIMAWYFQHATTNDYFHMALSGAGYVHPYRKFMGATPDPKGAWNAYLGLTKHYMDLLGLHGLALYTDAWRPFDRGVQDPITLKFAARLQNAETLILGMGRDEGVTGGNCNYVLGNNVLVAHVMTRWDQANIGRSAKNNLWLATEIRKHTPKRRPAFMHVHPLSWSYYPSDLVDVLHKLGGAYVAVSPRAYKKLYLVSRDDSARRR